jgi:hypothetical protein
MVNRRNVVTDIDFHANLSQTLNSLGFFNVATRNHMAHFNQHLRDCAHARATHADNMNPFFR